MYTIKALNGWTGEWVYFNTFRTYGEAVEELERLGKVYPNRTFKIFSEN